MVKAGAAAELSSQPQRMSVVETVASVAAAAVLGPRLRFQLLGGRAASWVAVAA